jgi:hypothetical protein
VIAVGKQKRGKGNIQVEHRLVTSLAAHLDAREHHDGEEAIPYLDAWDAIEPLERVGCLEDDRVCTAYGECATLKTAN